MSALLGLLLLFSQQRQEYVRVTFYTLRGNMADGVHTHFDAAACSKWIPFGTQLQFPDGYVVTCEDRGYGDYYWKGWVDVWAPSYSWGVTNIEAVYGTYSWVTVLRWGWPEDEDASVPVVVG